LIFGQAKAGTAGVGPAQSGRSDSIVFFSVWAIGGCQPWGARASLEKRLNCADSR